MKPGPQPESFLKAGTESAHQIALFCWAAQNFDACPELRLMFHIPNGGERNKIVAAKLKAEGVKSAIPDIFLPVPRGTWHGLFIELKKPKNHKGSAGKATDEQLAMIDALRQQGYGAVVCIGFEEARATVMSYLRYPL